MDEKDWPLDKKVLAFWNGQAYNFAHPVQGFNYFESFGPKCFSLIEGVFIDGSTTQLGFNSDT
jgi:hypothetical protein